MRKHFIVGTAGHVDHGKSSLIRALTGVDTDRLPEEKARGLSIDLGFAHLNLPGDVVAGIVDVPGHERFLKNMLAGVGGYDLGMLVVDAQEGVMPQTREHVEILDLLETPAGILVVNKVDLVDEEFLELVEDDLREFVAGTFLQEAPLIRVSARTGRGLEDLRGKLTTLLSKAQPRKAQGPARLPVDRVFSKAGFGTVVTGSLWSGTLHRGDRLTLWPEGEDYKVRGLQVHGQDCEIAVAGQRVAVNLSGVELSNVHRGATLATPDWLQPTQRLDVRLRTSPRLPRPLKHRSRIRLYHGSLELLGQILLLERDSLMAAEEGLAQLVLEGPLVVLSGDRLILRDFTSSYTLGGAVVVEPLAQPHRRHEEASVAQRLRQQEAGTLEERVLQELAAYQARSSAYLASQLQIPLAELEPVLENLSASSRLVKASKGWLPTAALEEAGEALLSLLIRLQNQAPWKSGWRKEEILKILNFSPPRLAEDALQWLQAQGRIQEQGRLLCLPGHQPQLPGGLKPAYLRVVEELNQRRFSPPAWPEVPALLSIDSSAWRILEPYLVERGEVLRIHQEFYLLRALLLEAHQLLSHLPQPFTASQAREALTTTRKYIIPLLEYMDQNRFCLRNGETRTIRPCPI